MSQWFVTQIFCGPFLLFWTNNILTYKHSIITSCLDINIYNCFTFGHDKYLSSLVDTLEASGWANVTSLFLFFFHWYLNIWRWQVMTKNRFFIEWVIHFKVWISAYVANITSILHYDNTIFLYVPSIITFSYRIQRMYIIKTHWKITIILKSRTTHTNILLINKKIEISNIPCDTDSRYRPFFSIFF